MIYHQAVLMRPDRFDAAAALLKEHFQRIARDTGCEFGELVIQKPQYFHPGLQILNVYAVVKKPMERPSFTLSEMETELLEGLWATLH